MKSLKASTELSNQEIESTTERYQVFVDGALWEDFGPRKQAALDLAIKMRKSGYRSFAKTLRY